MFRFKCQIEGLRRYSKIFPELSSYFYSNSYSKELSEEIPTTIYIPVEYNQSKIDPSPPIDL